MGKSLGKDPLTGMEAFHYYDYADGVSHIKTVQDVEPVIERNKYYQSTDHQSNGIKKNWWHCATIPNIIIEKWLREDGINFYKKEDWPAIKRKLNDPEWRYLRTGRGKL